VPIIQYFVKYCKIRLFVVWYGESILKIQKDKEKEMEIKKVVTHKKPHIDELAAYVVLQLVGKQVYPGIKSASLETLERREITSKTPKQWLDEGVLVIGAGGCGFEFDEHKKDKPAKASCLGLVLQKFGLEDDVLFYYLLKHITANDSGHDQHPFSLGNVLKEMYYDFPEEEVIKFGLMAIRSKIKGQAEFLSALKEAEKAGVKVLSQGTYSLKIVWIKSDNRHIVKALYCQSGLAANVGIVERSDGFKIVFVSRVFDSKEGSKILLELIAKDVRIAELEARGLSGDFDDSVLMSDKGPDILPMWHKLGGNLLLNTDYEPSKLTLEELKNIIFGRIKGTLKYLAK